MPVSYEPIEVARGTRYYGDPGSAPYPLVLTLTAPVPAGSFLVVWLYTIASSPSPTTFFASDSRNGTFYACRGFTWNDGGGSIPAVACCALFRYVVEQELQIGDTITVAGGISCGAVAAYFSYVRPTQVGVWPGGANGAQFSYTKSPNDNIYDLGGGTPHNDLTDLTQTGFSFLGPGARCLLVGMLGAECYSDGVPVINLTGTEQAVSGLDVPISPGPATTTYLVKGRMVPFYRLVNAPSTPFSIPANSPGVENWAGIGLFFAIWGDWSVRVVDPCTGLAVEGIQVTLDGPASSHYEGYTGEDGTVIFPGLAAGTYTYAIGPDFEAPDDVLPGIVGATTGTFTLTDGQEIDAGTLLVDRPQDCPVCLPAYADVPRTLFRELTGEYALAVLANAAVDRYLQTALEEINRRLHYFVRTATVAFSAEMQQGDLPDDFVKMVYVEAGGSRLLPRGSVAQWRSYGLDWRHEPSGSPREYALEAEHVLLYPPPSAAATDQEVSLTLRYVGLPEAVADCGPEALTRQEWTLVVFWAVSLWFGSKRSAQAARKAKFFRKLFETEIALIRPAYEERGALK